MVKSKDIDCWPEAVVLRLIERVAMASVFQSEGTIHLDSKTLG